MCFYRRTHMTFQAIIVATLLLVSIPLHVGAAVITNNTDIGTQASPFVGDGISVAGSNTVTNNADIYVTDTGIYNEEGTITNNGTIYSSTWLAILTGGFDDVLNNNTDASIQAYNSTGLGIDMGAGADSFTNRGTTKITYAADSGVSMGAGDDLLLNTGSLFVVDNGANGAIAFGAGTDIFNNTGTVRVDATADNAIDMGDDDDTLNNSKSITIGTVDRNGIDMGAGNDTLTNAENSSITIDEAIGTPGANPAVHVDGKGITMGFGDDTINNSGIIEIKKAHSWGIGLDAPNNPAADGIDAFYNTETGVVLIGETGHHGIAFGPGADLFDNDGIVYIEKAGGTLDPTTKATGIAFGSGADVLDNGFTGWIAIDESDRNAIDFGNDGSGDTLNNYGILQVGKSGDSAIALGSGIDLLDNQGLIEINKAGVTNTAQAIDFGLGDDELINGTTDNTAASITIGSASGSGIDMGSISGSDTLSNYGKITISNTGDASISFGDSADILINEGTLDLSAANLDTGNAPIDMGTGDDLVFNSGPINVNGSSTIMDGGDGTDLLQLYGDKDGTLTGNIINFENLEKVDDGTWTIDGNVDAYNSVSIFGGTLAIVNGVLADAPDGMVIDAGAGFSGNATVGDLDSSGTVSPGGDDIGTINVTGNYSESGDGRYLVTVGANEQSDLINVTGTATLSGATAVEITTDGYVADGDIFMILSSADLGGTVYNTPSLSDDSAVIDYYLLPSDDRTVLVGADRTAYASLGISENAAAVGNALIKMAEGGDADASDLVGQIDSLQNVQTVDDALGSFAPEQYPDLLGVSLAGSQLYRSSVIGRMGNLHLAASQPTNKTNRMTASGPAVARIPAFDSRGEGWSSWGRVMALSAEQEKSSTHSGYDYDTQGLSFGFDRKVNNQTAIGVGFGYANSDVGFDVDRQGTDISTFHTAVYTTWSNDTVYIDSALLYAMNDYDSQRRIPLLGLKATGETDGTEMGAYIGGGIDLNRSPTVYFIPTLSVAWGRVDIDGFKEKGAGGFGLEIDDMDSDSLVTMLGFRWGGIWRDSGVDVEPELRVAWAHEFGDTEREAQARFVGANTTFPITGIEPDEDSLLLGLGFNMFYSDRFTLFTDYDSEYRGDFTSHVFSLGCRYDY